MAPKSAKEVELGDSRVVMDPVGGTGILVTPTLDHGLMPSVLPARDTEPAGYDLPVLPLGTTMKQIAKGTDNAGTGAGSK